ncbi:MAG: hypothetical protein JO043_09280 [Candidatus Eremiobacteraeota bacterium]|nr:hypothetical protein [Candidatus Eremiobacteraeota bacterium]
MKAIAIGCVVRTVGELLAVRLPAARVGEGVRVHTSMGTVRGRVESLDGKEAMVAPFATLSGVAVGDRVETSFDALTATLGYSMLGRACSALGAPLDGGAPLRGMLRVVRAPADAGERLCVTTPFWTGVRGLDALLTIGRGARIGLFGGPGTGKSMLLEAIAEGARGDAVVIALIGERGREAAAWLQRVDARTTIVCATADRPAAERVRAAEVAMAQARTLRDAGLHVMLIVDSLARYATALRELRAGLREPPGRGGYPPTVLSALARYLECAGASSGGSITLIATVLSDGADEREPLSDAARAALDGHIVLSAELARGGRFPAIDVLASTSRTMHAVISEEHRRDASTVRTALSLLAETRDLRAVGFANAHDDALARAVAAEPTITAFLCQQGATPPHETLKRLKEIALTCS